VSNASGVRKFRRAGGVYRWNEGLRWRLHRKACTLAAYAHMAHRGHVKLAHRVKIHRPPEEVFTFLSDFANDSKWRANVLEMRALGSQSAMGGVWSRQIEKRRVPGRTIETEAVITAFEPPTRLTVQRASGLIRPSATYEIEATDAGTILCFCLEIPTRRFGILAWPFVALFLHLVVRPGLGPDFERLKRIIEAGSDKDTSHGHALS
jgi:hypothetical protein